MTALRDVEEVSLTAFFMELESCHCGVSFSFNSRNKILLHPICQLMQDEVSETENIRRNLSIERQFAEGCEELLDVEQIFIRQGIPTVFRFIIYFCT